MSQFDDSVSLMLGSKERNLRFDMRAAGALKRWTGLNALRGDNMLGEVVGEKVIPDPELLPAALAACLLHEDRAMNPDKAAELITMANIMPVMEAIGAAFAVFVGPLLDSEPRPMAAADPVETN